MVYLPTRQMLVYVCFRIPPIARGYDRVDTLPRSLTTGVTATGFMYPVRPFTTYYSVLSGPRYLGI